MYKERLIVLRESKGLKQYELANVLGIYKGLYNQYETEYEIIPLKYLNNLSNYFNVSLDFIFGFTNECNYILKNEEINLARSGKLLKIFRKENKLTQDALAKILNINRSAISKYEKGIHIIAIHFLYTICKKYGVSADYLLGKTDSPKYYSKEKDI